MAVSAHLAWVLKAVCLYDTAVWIYSSSLYYMAYYMAYYADVDANADTDNVYEERLLPQSAMYTKERFARGLFQAVRKSQRVSSSSSSSSSNSSGGCDYLGYRGVDAWVHDHKQKQKHKHCDAGSGLQRKRLSYCLSARDAGRVENVKALESATALFLGTESAAVFPSGSSVSASVLPLIADARTLIVVDDMLCGQTRAACEMTLGEIHSFQAAVSPESLDGVIVDALDHTERAIDKVLVVVSGVSAASGNIAVLPVLLRTACRYSAYVYMDEAHSVGTLGEHGRGICEYYNTRPSDKARFLIAGTFERAFSALGGFVAGRRAVVHGIRRHAAGIAHDTCLSDTSLLQAWSIIAPNSNTDRSGTTFMQRLQRLARNASTLRSDLRRRLGVEEHQRLLGQHDSPVIPVVTHDVQSTLRMLRTCLCKGIDMHGVVGPSGSRLCTHVSAQSSEEQVLHVSAAISEAVLEEVYFV